MPPKKKLSKAEKERLKAEEAERRAKEEEEARVRMEAEEKERRERERLEAEERARLEELERIRRNAQLLELNAIYDEMKTTLAHMHTAQIVQRKWERYMRCDGSPDPTIPGEINTYLNCQREENEGLTFQQVLEDSNLILALIDELKFIIEDSPLTEVPLPKGTEFKETILELESLLQYKLDQGCHQVFRDASILADQETGNLQTTLGGQVITLSCWGNLAKNPRLKTQAFTGVASGLLFDVPRPLALTDCAVRFLRTEFDHLSHLSQFFYPRIRTTPVEVVEEATTKKTAHRGKKKGKKGTASESKDGKDHDRDTAPSRDPSTMMSSRGGTQAASGLQRLSGTQTGGGAAANSLSAADESEAEDENRDLITPEPDYRNEKGEYIEFEDFGEAEDIVDLRAFQVLGGVMHFDLLHLPPQPKTVKNWTITQIDQPAIIKRMSYGKEWRHGSDNSGRASRNSNASATSAPNSRQGRNSVSGQSQSQVPTAKKESNPAFGITFRIPFDCVFFEPPLVARWEFAEKVWRTSDLEEMTYDEEKKTYSFKTFKFGPIACLQDKHINFPFQSWELRPLSGSSALFTINAALVDVEIEIQGDKCCLRKPIDMPQLEGILGRWIFPKALIKFMKGKGANIFPDDDSRKYVMNSYKRRSITHPKVPLKLKHTWIEGNLYQQMALCSHVLAFSYSKWNTDSGEKRLVLQAAEANPGQPISDDAWGIFLMTSKRCMALKMKENDETFSEDLREGTEIMSNFYHMAQHIGSEGLIQRLKSVDYSFIKAVKELLDATQLITFA